MWILVLLACRDEPSKSTSDPTASPRDTEEPHDTVPSTAATGSTGSTGHTGTPTTPTTPTGDTGSTPPVPPVDCATYVPQAVQSRRQLGVRYSTTFSTRPDGQFWFVYGDFVTPRGIYEGLDPATSTIVYPLQVDQVYEDPHGVLHILDGQGLTRVDPGQPPTLVASGFSLGNAGVSDMTVHPEGTVTFSSFELTVADQNQLTTILADGTVHQVTQSDVGFYLVSAVAYDADFSHLWLLEGGLWNVEVDSVGIPDWSTLAQVPIAGTVFATWGSDMVADECGGLWVVANEGYGFGRLFRYDTATGTIDAFPGNVDFGYGGVPLRFGRAPGEEHFLMTMSGGWQTARVDLFSWDVGVAEAPWP